MFKIIMFSIIITQGGASQLSQGFDSMETCQNFARSVLPKGVESMESDTGILTRRDPSSGHVIRCVPSGTYLTDRK